MSATNFPVSQHEAPPRWARWANAALTVASGIAFAIVLLPVIQILVAAFNGIEPGIPPPRLFLGTLIFLACAIPVASVYASWRWLYRGATSLGLAFGAVTPTIAALLYGLVMSAEVVGHSAIVTKAN